MGGMNASVVSLLAAVLVLSLETTARAQLTAAKDGPIVYGHHHLNVTSIDAHRRFWVDTLGGTSIRVGTAPAEVFRLPNVLIFMNQRAPGGGTKGTTVNHVGFQVPNIRAMVDKVKAAGYPVVTRAELPAQYDVNDDLGFIPDLNTYVAFVMGPDDTKVEFVEDKAMEGSIALHHIHFAAPNVEQMRAWYVKTFGAKAGKRGSFEAADLPGVNLTFSAAPDPVIGTRGRALDHIGFEVKNLEEFCRQLEASGVKLNLRYTRVPAYALAAAFITDPWGTYIELTEGLDTVP
jgi:catechol 2,3-dioxygenase-like lactoylglutathione lyase family enzyme